MRIVMHDHRKPYPTSPSLPGVSSNISEVHKMSSQVEQILKAIEDVKNSISKINDDMARTLLDIQREQLNLRRELVSIQREEMNLRVDAVKNMKELTKNDDLDFLKRLDVIDNEYLDKTIERTKRIQELHNEAIFK